MIVFLLSIMVCTSSPEKMSCAWQEVGHFIDDDYCHDMGKSFLTDSRIIGYKCVLAWRDDHPRVKEHINPKSS